VIERLWRWRVALMVAGVTLLAATLRFTSLGFPNKLVFDEVYYVRGAYSLLNLGYEANWAKDEGTFETGDYSHLSTQGDYIVHPMVGKLLIALGMKVAGVNPFGWRLSAAVFGTLTVLIVALLAKSMLKSTLWGGVAGVLLAVDGEAIVMSRTALLDGFLTFFLVAALALLWLDRRWLRRRLDARPPGWDAMRAPRTGPRWWRLAAMVTLGLACGTKWSGPYFAAAFLIMSVVWDALDRRHAGYQRWLANSFWRAAVPGAVGAIIIIPAVYLLTWANWFFTSGSYMRDWAGKNPTERISWMPGAVQSLWEYHRKMLEFHAHVTSPHPYESHPNGWILQFRPTAFFWERVEQMCGADPCVGSVHALGIPLIWWAGLAALCFAVWRLFLHRDLMGLWMSVGVLAAWLPWVPFAHRTVFTFYTVSMAPFLVLLLAWAISRIARPPHLGGRYSYTGVLVVGFYIAAVLAVSAFFLPIWTGAPIPYRYWQAHMWLPTWG